MKILIVHNDYQQPGGERVAVDGHISLLQKHGFQVLLYLKDNAEIDRYSSRQKVGLFLSTIYSRHTAREIQNILRAERPDIVHIHNVFPLISASVYKAVKDCGFPLVQTVHNFRFMCPNGLFYTHQQVCELCKFGNTAHAVRLRCYRNSYPASALYAAAIGLHRSAGTFNYIDRFITPSIFTAQKLVESQLVNEDRISLLGHYLPEPLPEPQPPDLENPYLLFLGRLSQEKGILPLVEAMQSAPAELRLVICGVGPLEAEVRERMARLDLKNIELRGFVQGDEKNRLLARALATVVPSTCYEVFPLTVLESFGIGTPVLASNLGSLPFLVKDGETGCLFNPREPQTIMASANDLLQDPAFSRRLGMNGRERVKKYHTEASFIESIQGIYQKTIEESRLPQQAFTK
jgi:glycosyltransferase involved in cell wall biosynthesis